MPVDTCHQSYVGKLPRWQKNRDAFDGEDAVKPKGEAYLVAPGGFQPKDYDRYKQRAKWFGATPRTVEGYSGAIFQKEADVEASNATMLHLENVTLTGISADLLAYMLFCDQILVGRYGVLLDYSTEMARPYWSGYPAGSIINWRTRLVRGEQRLSLLVLKEEYASEQDLFTCDYKDRYRVCYLDDQGIYQVAIYEESGVRRNFGQVQSYTPMRRQRSMDFIPFQFFGVRDLTPDVWRGPLDDLVDVNYAYYRHSADYEHGLFLTGVPTPVITGHQLREGQTLPIGSLAAWVLPNADAKAYLLEYQGHGLESHERAMANDKQEMATLGARLLEDMPDTQETLGAVQIRHSGEQGNLKAIANLTSEGMSRLLRMHHWWNAETENVNDERFSYTLNTDLSVARLNPQEIQALVGLWQAGAISKQTLFWNLEQGELLPPETTYEDEQGLIESEAPARLPFGDNPAEQEDPVDEEEPVAA